MTPQSKALIALGALFWLAGIACIALRGRITAWNNRTAREWDGKPHGPGQRLTPGMVVAFAGLFVLAGAVSLGFGIGTNGRGSSGTGQELLADLIGFLAVLPVAVAIILLRRRDRKARG